VDRMQWLGCLIGPGTNASAKMTAMEFSVFLSVIWSRSKLHLDGSVFPPVPPQILIILPPPGRREQSTSQLILVLRGAQEV